MDRRDRHSLTLSANPTAGKRRTQSRSARPVNEDRWWPTPPALSVLVRHGSLTLDEALLVMVRRAAARIPWPTGPRR